MVIRDAKKSDMSGVLSLIQELAKYEKSENEVEITVSQLEKDGFGEKKLFDCIVAEENNEIIGIALYYPRYSTWKGKTIHLEDIVVKQSKRKQGIGAKLFDNLAGKCKTQGVKRMEWQVLDWNEPAINFYKKYNADLDSKWVNCELNFDQLQQF